MFVIPSEAERNKWLCWVICTLYPFPYIYSDVFSQNTGVLCVIGESNLPPSLKEKKKSTQDIGTNTLCYKLIYVSCLHLLFSQLTATFWPPPSVSAPNKILRGAPAAFVGHPKGKPGRQTRCCSLCGYPFSANLSLSPFWYQGTTVVLYLRLDSVRRKTNWILYEEEKKKKKQRNALNCASDNRLPKNNIKLFKCVQKRATKVVKGLENEI